MTEVIFAVNRQTGFHSWFLFQCACDAFVPHSDAARCGSVANCFFLQKESRKVEYSHVTVSNGLVTFVACYGADCVRRFRLHRGTLNFLADRKFREEPLLLAGQ